jgi:two-component system sensor histidine kinase YesM
MHSSGTKPHAARRHSIQTQLVGMFLISTLFVFGINLYLFHEINVMMGQIESVFSSNTAMNDLQTMLSDVQSSMTEYLNTKSSDSMEEYFRCQQLYSDAIQNLNSAPRNDPDALLEKDICGMSESYLALADAAVEAKRGRKADEYGDLYGQAAALYGYLDTAIYSLNNTRFQGNSRNYGVLLHSFRSFEVIDSILLCLTALMNAALSVLLLRRITQPLEKLAEAANIVASGELEVPPLAVRGNNEVSVVSVAFNQMVKNLRSNLEKLEESMAAESALREKELLMENHLKEAQLQSLQAQINPHFLFNTLNAGAQLAMMEGADKTYVYVQNVADFFRYNVQNREGSVTLADELELVDHYLYIMNVRYGGEISYEAHVDDGLKNLQMPSMILQPIIENCVKHGLRDIDRPGRIVLTVERQEDTVRIRIRDNGKGMDRKTLDDAVQKGTHAGKTAEGGVGLHNVAMRLQLFYGRGDVMSVYSAGRDQGVETTIQIPLEEAQDV